MPRKRQIDPAIWTSPQFMALSCVECQLLFIGMISNADDEGRLHADPRYLKATIFPAFEYKREQLCAWRSELADQELIQLYHNGHSDYVYLPNFKKHQYMTKRFPSKLPEPTLVNNLLLTTNQPVNNRLGHNEDEVGNGNEVEDAAMPLVKDNSTIKSTPATKATRPPKGNTKTEPITFEELRKNTELLESLQVKFPALDIAFELEKCQTYWEERGYRNAKLCFLNWLSRAKSSDQGNDPQPSKAFLESL